MSYLAIFGNSIISLFTVPVIDYFMSILGLGIIVSAIVMLFRR